MIEKTTKQNSVITARSLSKTFNKVEVIKSLTTDFLAGDRIGLIGQNGAGKTTLIRCILGQYTYDGNLEVLGMNPRKDHIAIMSEVGFIPQTPPPLKMTVREMLDLFVKLTDTSEEKFIDISKTLGLHIEDNFGKPFHKLSGGMKQKLLVSLALGKEPKILLMDEPSANLDPKAREVFFEYLKDYNKDALMILSSHRMDEIKSLVNRVVEMDMGNVVFDKIVEPI